LEFLKESKGSFFFFCYNQSVLELNQFKMFGKLIVWSLIHGGLGTKALHPAVYLLMCGQEGQLFDFHDLPDDEVQLKLQQVAFYHLYV